MTSSKKHFPVPLGCTFACLCTVKNIQEYNSGKNVYSVPKFRTGLCDLFWDGVPKPKTYCRRCPSLPPTPFGLIQPHYYIASLQVPEAH